MQTDKIIKSRSLLPIYLCAKKYYLFYFPEYTPVYYAAKETRERYQLIANKKENPINKKWLSFLNESKKVFPKNRVFNSISNNPSFYARIILTEKENRSVKMHISVSLIGPFYTIFIEKKYDGKTFIYLSPEREYEQIFKDYENLFEEIFPECIFLSSRILTANFFNLVAPHLNSNNIEDGQINHPITILQGLFFDFNIRQEGFNRIGDRHYKASEYLTLTLEKDKLDKMKELLNDNSIDYTEVVNEFQ